MQSAKYASPFNSSETSWAHHTLPNSTMDIRDTPITELDCGGSCQLTSEFCGGYVLRVLYSDGVVQNYDKLRLTATGDVWQPRNDEVTRAYTLHFMAHSADEDTASVLAGVPFAPATWPSDVLILGLGCGGRARFLHGYTPWRVEVAELDVNMFSVAQRYFGFPELPKAAGPGRWCTGDGRLCVSLKDALTQLEELLLHGRRFSSIYIDISQGGRSAVWSYDLAEQQRFFQALATLAPAVVWNYVEPADRPRSFALAHKYFGRTACVPLADGDTRGCFLLGLGADALDGDAARARARELDAQLRWAPFSIATLPPDAAV